MNILILGSGGREHAFALKLVESNKVSQLFVAPGNAGTHKIATNLPINITDFEAVKETVLKNNINGSCGSRSSFGSWGSRFFSCRY